MALVAVEVAVRVAGCVAVVVAVLASLVATGAWVWARRTAAPTHPVPDQHATDEPRRRPTAPTAHRANPPPLSEGPDDATADQPGYDPSGINEALASGKFTLRPRRAQVPAQPLAPIDPHRAAADVPLEPPARSLQREWPGLAAAAPAPPGPAAAHSKGPGVPQQRDGPEQARAAVASAADAAPPLPAALLPTWPAPMAAPVPALGGSSAASVAAPGSADQAPSPPLSPAPAKVSLALPTPVLTPPADPLPGCLATPTGGLVKSVWVSAKDGEGVTVHLPMARRYLVLAKGVFQYSLPGHQDAMRRWYDPPRDIDPTCVNCAFHPLAAKYALQLNGVAHKPVRSCVVEHLHLFSVLAPTATLHVRIADAKMDGEPYGDNEGGLTIEVWQPLASDSAVWPEWDGATTVQGVPTGPWIGELMVGTNWVLSVQAQVVLHKEHATLTLPAGTGPLYADLYGTTAWQGSERDWRRQWDHVQKLSGFGPPPVGFNCEKVQEVANSHIHRYLLRLEGCSGELQMTLLAPLGVGQFTAEIYRGP